MLHQNVELYNVVELTKPAEGDGFYMLRVPAAVREKLNDGAKKWSFAPTGAEIRFNLQPGQSAKVILSKEGDTAVPAVAEVYQGSFRVNAVTIESTPTELVVTHPGRQADLQRLSDARNTTFDARLTRILLPPIHTIRLLGIEGEMTPPQPGQTPKRRYLVYGSSITHGAHVCRPSGTYPMIVARNLGVDLINEGYAGGAHMEEVMAQYLAARDDWDFASLEMGINVGGWGDEQFDEYVRRFVGIIGNAHRDKWIFCIDIFTFKGDLGVDHKYHKNFRQIVAKAVADATLPRLVHVDGREILKDFTGLSTDLCHPTDDGFAEMGANLTAVMRQTMGS